MNKIIIAMKNIHKRFGKTKALEGVDFTINENEIVGLVGDNGAGKSTLIKILSGIFTADIGEIYFNSKKVTIRAPWDAIELGIGTIHQDQALVNEMSVARNIFMGREPTTMFNLIDKNLMREQSMNILRDIGLSLKSPEAKVKSLSGGERQGIAIARAMYFNAKILLMDEPTSALSIKESKKILEFIRKLKQKGVSCVFVTHNLYHVYPVADRFTVLSHGRKIKDIKKKNTSIEEMEKYIIK